MNRRADFVLIVNQPFERSQTFVDYFTLASLIVFRVLSNCSAIGRIRNRSDLFLESKHREPSRVFSVERPSMFVKYRQAAFCADFVSRTLREEVSWFKILRRMESVDANSRFCVFILI